MRELAFASVWLFVFSIPLENAIAIPAIGTMGRLIGMFAFIIAIFSTLALKMEIRLHLLHWLMFAFILMAASSFYWSIDPVSTLERLWTYIQLLVMMWVVFQSAENHEKVINLLRAYVLGSFFLVFGILSSFAFGTNSVRYEAYNFNPNDLASILALGIPLAWYLFIRSDGKINRIYAFYPLISPVAIFLTASRSGLIKLILAFVFILWTSLELTKRNKLILLVVLGLSVYAILVFVPPGSWQRLSTTANDFTGGNFGGRTYIWNTGFEVFCQNPLLGIGAGTFSDAVEPYLGVGAAPHNVFLAILVEQGVVGLGLFTLILLTALFCAFQMAWPERKLWLIILAIWGVCALSGNWEWRKQTWLLFVMIVAHCSVLRAGDSREGSSKKIVRFLNRADRMAKSQQDNSTVF